jgi:hypothetical protein
MLLPPAGEPIVFTPLRPTPVFQQGGFHPPDVITTHLKIRNLVPDQGGRKVSKRAPGADMGLNDFFETNSTSRKEIIDENRGKSPGRQAGRSG